MKLDIECAFCMPRWVYERASISIPDKNKYDLLKNIYKTMSDEYSKSINIGSLCNKIINSINDYVIQSVSYWNILKAKCNISANKLIPTATDYVIRGIDEKERFFRSCYIASTSNVSPMNVPNGAFEFIETNEVINGKYNVQNVIGDIYKVAKESSNILYVADNAGEIGFDGILINLLKQSGKNIDLVVKDTTFFDDATLEDVKFFNIDKSVNKVLITNGVFVPNEAKSELLDSYNKSDLIISKGTGNFEALKDETNGKQTIYMLKSKCKPVENITGINIGQFMIFLDK